MLRIRRSRRDSRKAVKFARALAQLDASAGLVRPARRRGARISLGA